jgi:hypothetical protein
MAYYLKTPSSGSHKIQISGITGNYTVSWELAEDMPPDNTTRYLYDARALLDSGSNSGSGYLLYIGNDLYIQSVANPKINNTSSSFAELFTASKGDIVEFSSTSPPSDGVILIATSNNGSPLADFSIYNVTITDESATHTINMSDSSGNTNEFASDTGILTIKLTGFPVDDSQWVFYGAAGGVTGDAAFNLPVLTLSASGSATVAQPTATGAFTLNLLAVSASGTATLPQPEISGSFSLQPVTVSSTGSATLPQPNIIGAFSVPLLTLSGATSATLPQPDIIGAFSYPLLTVSASGSATTANPFISGNITFEKLIISGAASATLPQPDISGAFSLPKLTVSGTASALVPQPIINGNIALEKLTISASGAATLPQPIAIGAFNIPIATVSGFATISGLTLIIDSKTNINQQFLSANISQNNLSNNIIYY